jgi:hypothetical protein
MAAIVSDKSSADELRDLLTNRGLITVKEIKRSTQGRHGRQGDVTIDCNSGTVVLVGAIG